MFKKLLTFSLLLCLSTNASWAIYAPRAMGMGGAFTAIADDAFAACYNPAGFAVNPGVDVAGSYQMTNRNRAIGDNALGIKGCFEVPMSPWAWIAGVGIASIFAMEGAKYLAEEGVVKKGWGRGGEKVAKEEPMTEKVTEEEEKMKAEGKEVERKPISRKEVAKKAAKEVARGTIHVGEKFAKAALQEAARQTRHYYYTPHWYRPHYYRPSYWDDRYDYPQRELTPDGKAQFALGLTVMSDQNAILNQDTNWYSFSLASGWGEIVALGANFNLYDLKRPSDGVRGLGAGFDLGGLLRIQESLMFGLAIKELLTTDIKWETGPSTRYEMTVNGGMALKPIRQITISADVHNIFGQNSKDPTMHYGVEVRPVYGVAFRAGLSDTDQAKQNKTAGMSIGIGQLIIDYAYLGGAYSRTQIIGASWKI
jgi:hypothetical protein